MSIAYIGLGSNLGDRPRNLEAALALLEERQIVILKRSSVIETNPAGGPPQHKFLNAAIQIETKLQPEELLKTIQSIEKKLGRKKTVRNGPRIIDLDILLYDAVNLETTQLTIPHPRMFERDFVMIPLKEITPELVTKKSYARH